MSNNQPLTEIEFKEVLPAKLRKNVNQKLMDQINATIADPVILDSFRDNLLGFASVLKMGKFKMPDYICAVKYVSFKLMGDTNKDAYIKTFPGKYAGFVKRGVSSKDIASYSTAYNKTKLVNLIFEQSLVPVHVLNAPMYQQALNVQADLMMNAKSEFVRSQAANSVMSQLKPPESAKVELDINVKEDESIKALRATTMELARQQQQMIKDGSSSVRTIAESKLLIPDNTIEAEIVE